MCVNSETCFVLEKARWDERWIDGKACAAHATDIKSIVISRDTRAEQCRKDIDLAMHKTLAVRSGVDPTSSLGESLIDKDTV